MLNGVQKKKQFIHENFTQLSKFYNSCTKQRGVRASFVRRRGQKTIKITKSRQKKEKFRSDYRGGKVASDKAHTLFGALL